MDDGHARRLALTRLILNEKHSLWVSRVCRVVYAAIALANLGIFFYWGGDWNNISIAVLLVMFIFNQRLIDMWRISALVWRTSAEEWRQSAAEWRAVAQRYEC